MRLWTRLLRKLWALPKNQYGLPLRLSLKYSMKTIIKSKLNYYINTLGTESAFFRGYSCEKAVSKWVIQRNVRQTQHKTNCQSNAVFQSTTDSSKKLQSLKLIIAHRPPWTFKLKFNRPVTINDAYVQTEIFQSRSLKVPGFPWGRRADRCRAWWEQYDITRAGGGAEVKVTIYHWPPNILRIITSWQEDLVENYQMGFDERLGCLSDAIQLFVALRARWPCCLPTDGFSHLCNRRDSFYGLCLFFIALFDTLLLTYEPYVKDHVPWRYFVNFLA